MYAITGITGQVGGVVARTLLDAGRQVRAVVRDANKGIAWRDRGCEVTLADLSDVAATTNALREVEAAFLLIPPLFDPAPGFPEVRSLVAGLRTTILEARPGRLVCLSTIGAQATQPNLLGQLGLVEEALGDLPLPVAFLRASHRSRWRLLSARCSLIQSKPKSCHATPGKPCSSRRVRRTPPHGHRCSTASMRAGWNSRARRSKVERRSRPSSEALLAALIERSPGRL